MARQLDLYLELNQVLHLIAVDLMEQQPRCATPVPVKEAVHAVGAKSEAVHEVSHAFLRLPALVNFVNSVYIIP